MGTALYLEPQVQLGSLRQGVWVSEEGGWGTPVFT